MQRLRQSVVVPALGLLAALLIIAYAVVEDALTEEARRSISTRTGGFGTAMDRVLDWAYGQGGGLGIIAAGLIVGMLVLWSWGLLGWVATQRNKGRLTLTVEVDENGALVTRPSPPPPAPPDVTQERADPRDLPNPIFQKEIDIRAMADDEAKVEDRVFMGCAITGPAVVVPLATSLVDSTFDGTPDSVLWEIPDRRTLVLGAIGLIRCRFYGCTFTNIGFAGKAPFIAEMRKQQVGQGPSPQSTPDTSAGHH